jgi:lysophospholipase L1-like esterase
VHGKKTILVHAWHPMHIIILKGMKKNFFFLLVLTNICQQNVWAQTGLVREPSDSNYYSTYYEQKRTMFRSLPLSKKDIVFLGNSLTDIGEWAEIWQNPRVKNRGISGDNSFGVLARIEEIAVYQPQKIFLMIGINDIARNTPVETIVGNTAAIIDRVKKRSPQTQFILQSVLPTNNLFKEFLRHQNKDMAIQQLNQALARLAQEQKIVFVDFYPLFLDATGKLSPTFTNDGLHLTGAGYALWKKTLQDLKLL